MSGPLPKPPELRQRMNKTSTAAVLPPDGMSEPREIPPLLPERKRWHVLTRAWWEDVWQSPMASEYVQADIHRLYLLAVLVDKFWKAPTIALAGEIRLQGQCFGLTPIDRRRLQWEVAKAEDAQRKRAPVRPEPKSGEKSADPRLVLVG